MDCSRCQAQFNWSDAMGYEEQETVPPMDLTPSFALPYKSESERRFKISRAFKSIFFRRREMEDVC